MGRHPGTLKCESDDGARVLAPARLHRRYVNGTRVRRTLAAYSV